MLRLLCVLSSLQALTACLERQRARSHTIAPCFCSFTMAESPDEAKLLVQQVLEEGVTTLLGIGPSTSKATVKSKFRELAMKLHPDRNHAPKAGEAFRVVQEAYELAMEFFDARETALSHPRDPQPVEELSLPSFLNWSMDTLNRSPSIPSPTSPSQPTKAPEVRPPLATLLAELPPPPPSEWPPLTSASMTAPTSKKSRLDIFEDVDLDLPVKLLQGISHPSPRFDIFACGHSDPHAPPGPPHRAPPLPYVRRHVSVDLLPFPLEPSEPRPLPVQTHSLPARRTRPPAPRPPPPPPGRPRPQGPTQAAAPLHLRLTGLLKVQQ